MGKNGRTDRQTDNDAYKYFVPGKLFIVSIQKSYRGEKMIQDEERKREGMKEVEGCLEILFIYRVCHGIILL